MSDGTTLYTLNLSHFCEKARWALDWHRIAYDEVRWPPGPHRTFAKGAGASDTSLPLLVSGEEIVQGSSEIIDWADANGPDPDRCLTLPDAAEAAREIEQRAGDGLGIHVRRLSYGITLNGHAHLFRPALLKTTTLYHYLLGAMVWPITKPLMIKALKALPEEVPKSRARIEEELDRLDGLLADGRSFLVGDRFSRADVTVASMLAPIARPPEMPVYHDLPLPQALRADIERWSTRRSIEWTRTRYRLHRTRQEHSARKAG